MKKITHLSLKFLLITCLFWNVGSQASTRLDEAREQRKELAIQNMLFFIGLNDGIYYEAMKQPSNNLTKEVAKSALSFMMIIWAEDISRNQDKQIENTLNFKSVNALCLASKIILNPQYAGLNDKFKEHQPYQEFFTWLNQKEALWQNILKKSTAPKLEHSCLDIT